MSENPSNEAVDITELDDNEFLEQFNKNLGNILTGSEVTAESGASNEDEESVQAPDESGGAESVASDDNQARVSEASTSEETEESEGNDDEPSGNQGKRVDPYQGDTASQPDPDDNSESTQSDLSEAEQLSQLLAPLKADRRMVEIPSIEKARQLMQMGINYNRRIQNVKPYEKMMKSLDKAGILNESDLNYLIDLHNKEPEAVKKLLKDSEIDPYELDQEEGAEYRPRNHMMSDKEAAVETVLDEISNSNSYEDVLKTVESWDRKSKNAIIDEPEVLKFLTLHMENGVYERIVDTIENEKALGNSSGLSDLDMYKSVGRAMYQQGAFNDLAPNVDTPQPSGDTKQGNSQDSKGSDGQSKKSARKRAASPPSGNASKGQKQKPNFLSDFSDDEIDKMPLHSAI